MAMSYTLSGRLRAQTCGGEVVPLGNATLKVYRQGDTPDTGFAIRQHEEIRDRDYLLICQGRTNEDGEFRLDFREKTIYGHRGSTHAFGGEPFVLEVIARSADGAPLDHDPEPVQFSLGEITAAWEGSEDDRSARWEHEISETEWTRVRQALDAWTIIGRVVRAGSKEPLQGLRVFAYDADLMQDDFLGSTDTDAEGRFRIDYPGMAFRQTAVPGAGYERGGPEIYFRVETAGGQVVLKEEKARGNKPDRADASNCFQVELEVDNVPSTA
jgi:hypothetical protein